MGFQCTWHKYKYLEDQRCDYIEKCNVNTEIKSEYTRKDLCASLQEHEKSYHNIPFKCKLTFFEKNYF